MPTLGANQSVVKDSPGGCGGSSSIDSDAVTVVLVRYSILRQSSKVPAAVSTVSVSVTFPVSTIVK